MQTSSRPPGGLSPDSCWCRAAVCLGRGGQREGGGAKRWLETAAIYFSPGGCDVTFVFTGIRSRPVISMWLTASLDVMTIITIVSLVFFKHSVGGKPWLAFFHTDVLLFSFFFRWNRPVVVERMMLGFFFSAVETATVSASHVRSTVSGTVSGSFFEMNGQNKALEISQSNPSVFLWKV